MAATMRTPSVIFHVTGIVQLTSRSPAGLPRRPPDPHARLALDRVRANAVLRPDHGALDLMKQQRPGGITGIRTSVHGATWDGDALSIIVRARSSAWMVMA